MDYYLFTELFVSTKKIEKIRQDRAAFTNSTNYEQALGGKFFFIYSITVLVRSLVVR